MSIAQQLSQSVQGRFVGRSSTPWSLVDDRTGEKKSGDTLRLFVTLDVDGPPVEFRADKNTDSLVWDEAKALPFGALVNITFEVGARQQAGRAVIAYYLRDVSADAGTNGKRSEPLRAGAAA